MADITLSSLIGGSGWNGGTVTTPINITGAQTASPLSISGAMTGVGRLATWTNTDTSTNTAMGLQLISGTGSNAQFSTYGSEYTGIASLAGRSLLENITGNGLTYSALSATGDHIWTTGAARTERMHLTSAGLLELTGSFTITGTGRRISADFSNATQTNRAAFQTSTTNGSTTVAAIPNGTSTTALLAAVSDSAYTNFHTLQLRVDATQALINSSNTGTGTLRDIQIQFNGVEKARFFTDGRLETQSYIAVKGANSGVQYFDRTNTSNAWVIYSDANILRFYGPTGADRMTLNDTGDLTVSGDIYLNGASIIGDAKEMFRFSDAWLRLNPTTQFTSGIYCGTGLVRNDGPLQVGTTTTAGLYVTTTVFNYQGNEVWHAGNDGAGSGLDADLLDGMNASAVAGANTIVARNASGYIYANFFNCTANVATGAPSHVAMFSSSDNFIRQQTLADFGGHIRALSGQSALSADYPVAGILRWKNYGNNHTIIDASQGTSPSGSALSSNANPDAAWIATYPTLMGWNGSSTYGVRVYIANLADGLSGVGVVAGSRIYSGYDAAIANSISCSAWFRSNGGTGWYNASYGGGINMDEATTVKVYGGKHFSVLTGTCYAADFSASSDIRLKKEVVDYVRPKVRLRPVTYKWRSSGEEDIGFVAQEVEKDFPLLVDIDSEGYKSVSYAKATAVLASQLNDTEDRLEDALNRIAALEKLIKEKLS